MAINHFQICLPVSLSVCKEVHPFLRPPTQPFELAKQSRGDARIKNYTAADDDDKSKGEPLIDTSTPEYRFCNTKVFSAKNRFQYRLFDVLKRVALKLWQNK